MTYEGFSSEDDDTSANEFTIIWGDNATQIEARTPAVEKRGFKEWLGRFFVRVHDELSVQSDPRFPSSGKAYVTLGEYKNIPPNENDFDAVYSSQFTSGGANMMAEFNGIIRNESGDWKLRPDVVTFALRYPAGTSPITGFETFTERVLTLDPNGYTFNVGFFERNHLGDLTEKSFGYFMDGTEPPRSSSDSLANKLFELPPRSTYETWHEIAPMAEFCLDQSLR
jgi:hypothetical protein